MNELRLEAPHTHLYPGLVGNLVGAIPAASAGQAAPCQVAFSDGTMALGSLTVTEATDAVLDAGPYMTAAGTKIPRKRWRIALSRDNGRAVRFRVRAKLQPPA